MGSSKLDNRPENLLISVAVMTYNQEKYAIEALQSVLSQTYNNIEIIVSDDCSKDGTWNMMMSEVDRYLNCGGVHRNIVMNRNKENLGVAKHFEKILSLCHGALVVCQAGDDISLPERIQVLVDALMKHPSATVISHEAICIDENGHEVGDNIMHTSALMPLGALMASSRRVYEEFGPISEMGAWEDDVYARRAQMIGDEIRLERVLLKYRIGCGGISRGKDDVKVRRTRVALGCLAAARQSRKDLEHCKDSISADKFSKTMKDIVWYENRYADEYDMYNAKNWMRKVRAYHRLYKQLKCLSYVYHFAENLLPSWMFIAIKPFANVGRRVFRL